MEKLSITQIRGLYNGVAVTTIKMEKITHDQHEKKGT